MTQKDSDFSNNLKINQEKLNKNKKNETEKNTDQFLSKNNDNHNKENISDEQKKKQVIENHKDHTQQVSINVTDFDDQQNKDNEEKSPTRHYFRKDISKDSILEATETRSEFGDSEFVDSDEYTPLIHIETNEVQQILHGPQFRKFEDLFPIFQETKGWIIENKTEEAPSFELKEEYPFRDNYKGKEYANYITKHPDKGIVLVSVYEAKKNDKDGFQVFIWTENGNEILHLSKSDIDIPIFRSIFCMGPSLNKIFSSFDPSFKNLEILTCEFGNTEDEGLLLQIEDSKNIKKYKFGVVYIDDTITSEEEIYDYANGSHEYDEFLKILGEKVELKGFKGYRGGLDIKHGTNGTQSLYTVWKEMEIMFHVATLMPTNKNKDILRIEKKKHIGNDLVVILFVDGNEKLKPDLFLSHQIHIVIAVRPFIPKNSKETHYIVQVAQKDIIEEFGPFPPSPPIFNKSNIRDFLLAKACIGERQTTSSGIFASRFQKYIRSVLESIFEKYDVL